MLLQERGDWGYKGADKRERMNPNESHIIGMASQKAGVGKTIISVNLSVALKKMGYNVLLVDSDTENPSVGTYLGMGRVNIGYRDVMYGKAELEQATSVHEATGISVLPGAINSKPFTPAPERVHAVGLAIMASKYDFVIFDTAPGFTINLTKFYGTAMIVTTPEMPAVTSCIRLAADYDNAGIPHNLIVNRIKNRRYEISRQELEQIYEKKIMADIIEEEIVPLSISEHIPAYIIDPNTGFYKSITKIAKACSAEVVAMDQSTKKTGVLDSFKSKLGLH